MNRHILLLGCKNYPAFSSGRVISGGMEIYVYELIRRLQNAFNFTLISGYSHSDDSAVKVISVPIFGKFALQPISLFIFSFFISLILAFSKKKINFVNAQTPLTGFIGYILKKIYKIPFITTVHIFASDPDHAGFLSKLYGIIERLVLKNSDCVICAGYNLRKHLIAKYGLDEASTIVINPGMNIPPTKSEVNCTNRKGSNASPVHLLFLGRLIQENGLMDLLKAMTFLRDKNVMLLIAGNGNLERAMRAYIQKESLGHVVKMLGVVQGDKKSLLLQNADISIRTSYHEVFPVAYLEAIAYGMPVIATPAGDTELIAQKTGAIHIVPMHNPEATAKKILELIESSKLSQEEVMKGMAFIKEISWENQAEKTSKIFNQIVRTG